MDDSKPNLVLEIAVTNSARYERPNGPGKKRKLRIAIDRKETRMKHAEWWCATWESEWRHWRPSWSGCARETSRVRASAWQQSTNEKRSGTTRARHVLFCLCNIPPARVLLIAVHPLVKDKLECHCSLLLYCVWTPFQYLHL